MQIYCKTQLNRVLLRDELSILNKRMKEDDEFWEKEIKVGRFFHLNFNRIINFSKKSLTAMFENRRAVTMKEMEMKFGMIWKRREGRKWKWR